MGKLYAGGAKPKTSSGGGSGGGTVVTVLNKTGKNIVQTEKVWINNGDREAGNYLQTSDTYSGEGAGPVIDPSGNFAFAGNKIYSLSADTLTEIGTLSTGVGMSVYGLDNSMFLNKTRADVNKQYTLSGYPIPQSTYMITGANAIKKFDMETGTASLSYTVSGSGTLANERIYIAYDNNVYQFNSNKIKITLNDEISTAVLSKFTCDGLSTNLYILGRTTDNKYIIGSTSSAPISSNSNLRIIEYLGEDHFKVLSQDEMPADLQLFYSNTKCRVSFNPNNGVLCVINSNLNYVVMRYKNNAWVKLDIDLGYPVDISSVVGGVTFSNDMTRCAIGYKTESNPNTTGRFINLVTTTGFVASAYKPYNITVETVTGFAKTAANIDGSFEASIAAM